MAKIWPVYEGSPSTADGPWAELSLSEAVALFELRPDDFMSDLDVTPRFGPVDRNLTYAGFKHIIVEVDRSEGRQGKWRPGFYRSRIKPTEAFGRLLRQALASKLGADNVVRVHWERTTDSQDREALGITVVIPPEAIQKLKGEAVLDALVKLRERLGEMGDVRTPIVEYATEAELAQDATP